MPWASGWYEAERHNQKRRTIDARMDDDTHRRIPRALYGPRYGEHDRQEEKQDAKAETEVKQTMKKSLNEPGAPTEHRLLTRLDEPAPPELLADNVEHKERQPECKNVVLIDLQRPNRHEGKVRRQSRPDACVEKLQTSDSREGKQEDKAGQAPLLADQVANAQMLQDRGRRWRRQRHPRAEQRGGEKRCQYQRAARKPGRKRFPPPCHKDGQQLSYSQPKQQRGDAEQDKREPNANPVWNGLLLSVVNLASHVGLMTFGYEALARGRGCEKLMTNDVLTLAAISVGTVFMGGNTCIGSARV
jgi:hypothetical protein